ncbi:hypothetical protein EUTSA_v10028305mg, partial [Eutrema salsugineum]
ETLKRAIDDVKEWISASSTGSSISANIFSTSGHHDRWRPLSRDMIKCNYDASHHEGARDSGLGWIIRNGNGTFLESGMGKFQGRCSPEEAEFEFEGDNLNLTRTINNYKVNLKLQHYLSTIHNLKHMH